nr:polysaccharide pyruvyl transferase family protein [uncultured Hyphomonas sp.]
MPKTGILSILPRIDARSASSFDRLYQMVGQNTGNLLFTNAVWNQIAGPKERINFTFDPGKLNEQLGALVIPAANWLSPRVDFSHLADLVEKLTIPVVLIGLGAQDAGYSGQVTVPDGTVRFVRAVAQRSSSVSVRGDYTRQILAGFGITNVTVTGCPSLYHNFRPFTPPRSKLHVRFDRGLFHATRYSASYAPFARTKSLQRDLFQLAYQNGMDILFQSEPEEMRLLTGLDLENAFDDRLKGLLLEIYGAQDWDKLVDYVLSHGRLFFDVDEWSRALDYYDYVLGTRLHGTIMALNSGVPAVLVHHDSRTREMAEFAAIPSVALENASLDPKKIVKLLNGIEWKAYYDRREQNAVLYKQFLLENALPALEF